jgi:hypothetical protein
VLLRKTKALHPQGLQAQAEIKTDSTRKLKTQQAKFFAQEGRHNSGFLFLRILRIPP